MSKFTVFTPNDAGLAGLLDLLRFTGAISGYTVHSDGVSVVLPQPTSTRAGLWESYCKERNLSIGLHAEPVLDENAPAAPEPAPPTPVKKKVVRRSPK